MSATPTVGEPEGGWTAPWPHVWELAQVLPVERWALVGGLMVQAHAMASGVETTRVTVDVDAAARIEVGAFTYADAAASLIRLGYTFDASTKHAYRFRREADVLDLMVADHERPPPRFAQRSVMQIEGGQQALARLQVIRFEAKNMTIDVPVPTLHGALILKAAAHTADSRDSDRHLLDAITLLACIADIGPMVTDLRGSDRKRLTHLLVSLQENPLLETQAPRDTAELARRTANDLRHALLT